MYMTISVLMILSLKLNVCFHDDVEEFAGHKQSIIFKINISFEYNVKRLAGYQQYIKIPGGGQDKLPWSACPPTQTHTPDIFGINLNDQETIVVLHLLCL